MAIGKSLPDKKSTGLLNATASHFQLHLEFLYSIFRLYLYNGRMNNLGETKKICDLFMQAYNSIGDATHTWARSKAPLRRNLSLIYMTNYGDHLPREYKEAHAELFIDSQALTKSSAIKRILGDIGSTASDTVKQALSFWSEHPGFWCFYAIKETHEDDFFLIDDLITGQTHLLHSPNIAYMQTNPLASNKHYLSLMLPNGSCLQTIGFPKFNLLSSSDMQYYTSLSSPGLDLTNAFNNNFHLLSQLDTISGVPALVEEEIALKRTWQPFQLGVFDITALQGSWALKDRKTQQTFTFTGWDTSMKDLPNYHSLASKDIAMEVILVREKKSGEMGLITDREQSYTLFSVLLTRTFGDLDLPNNPAVSISLALASLLDEGDYPVPWKKFITILGLKKKANT